jgi:hypothetical protein
MATIHKHSSLQTIRTTANYEIRKSIFIQLHAAQTVVSIARRRSPLDDQRTRCIRSVRKTLETTEARLWKTSLEPVDILTISAEVERLWFQIDALS